MTYFENYKNIKHIGNTVLKLLTIFCLGKSKTGEELRLFIIK